MSNLSFHGQRGLSTGLQLQQKVQNYTDISNCCLTRRQVRAKPQIFECWAKIVMTTQNQLFDPLIC